MAENRQRIIYNFSALNPEPYWRIVNDRVMGGVSESSFSLTQSRTGVFQGELSLKNSGGFSSLRFTKSLGDLSGLIGFLLRCRGDGQIYQFRIYSKRPDANFTYTQNFRSLNRVWKVIHLPLKDFTAVRRGSTLNHIPPPQPGDIQGAGLLIADQQQGPFYLELDWLGAAFPAADR